MTSTTTNGHPAMDRCECWCCGSVESPDRMVRLGNHPEVSLCVRCSHWAAKQAWSIEDQGREGAAVFLRGRLRRARQFVIDQGWHRSRFGGPIRWIGKRLP